MCARSDASSRITASAHALRAAAQRAGAVPVAPLVPDDSALDQRTDEASIVAGRSLRRAFRSAIEEALPRSMASILDPISARRKGEET